MRPSLKDEVPSARILDLPLLYYFRTIASSILASAVHEFLEFLNIQPQEFGDRIIRPGSGSSKYAGSLLPDAHSNFGKGYRVVSFYIDPESLLSKCFVLRRSAWERAPNLYQRMISKKKIGQIRKYLVETERVFLNNIVVSLPSDVVILKDGEIIKEDLTRTKQVEVQLPDKPNTIGLIDGQHRVYSYHSGGSNEQKIGQLRRHLNLLVTGIIFPDSLSQEDRTRFEANLFLEINSTQTGAKSDLKQEIGLILYPSSGESIARRVIIKMGEVGPLAGLLSSAMLGARGVKTTTIVSYGLMPLLKLSGDDSIYSLLEKSAKESLIKNPSDEAIANYVDRATKEVNLVISAAKDAIGAVGWITVGSKGTLRITPTLINGLISYLRLAIQSKKKLSFEAHRAAMSKLLSVNPMSFKSSQYNRLGKAIFAAAYPASKGS